MTNYQLARQWMRDNRTTGFYIGTVKLVDGKVTFIPAKERSL